MAQGKKITPAKINALLAYNHLPLLPEQKLATPCPTCHIVHGDGLDCHGNPIAAVVCLAPGEVVALAPAPAKRKRVRPDAVTVHVSRETLWMLRAVRQQADLSDDMMLRRLLREHNPKETP